MIINDLPENEKPKIEFPCPDYPIKVLGDAAADFKSFCSDLMAQHAEFDAAMVSVKDSRNGKFQSVTFLITATGVEQLEALHVAFKASGRVKMVM